MTLRHCGLALDSAWTWPPTMLPSLFLLLPQWPSFCFLNLLPWSCLRALALAAPSTHTHPPAMSAQLTASHSPQISAEVTPLQGAALPAPPALHSPFTFLSFFLYHVLLSYRLQVYTFIHHSSPVRAGMFLFHNECLANLSHRRPRALQPLPEGSGNIFVDKVGE